MWSDAGEWITYYDGEEDREATFERIATAGRAFDPQTGEMTEGVFTWSGDAQVQLLGTDLSETQWTPNELEEALNTIFTPDSTGYPEPPADAEDGSEGSEGDDSGGGDLRAVWFPIITRGPVRSCIVCHNPIVMNGGSIAVLPLSYQQGAMEFLRVNTLGDAAPALDELHQASDNSVLIGKVALSILLEPFDWYLTSEEIGDDPTNLWSYAGLIPFVPAATSKLGKGALKGRLGGIAPKGPAVAEEGGLSLFKWNQTTSTRASGWREGDRFLHLPNQGSARANWAQNSTLLRQEMRSGRPIFDSHLDDAGNLIPTQGFLNAERNLLINRGWSFNPSTGAWHPPLGN